MSQRVAPPPAVVIVSHYALPHIGGIEVVVDREVRTLAAAGHRVTLVTSDVGGEGGSPGYPAGVRVVRLSTWNWMESRLQIPYPLVTPAAAWRLAALLRTSDVVHVHGAIYPISALAIVLARLLGKKVILTEHSGPQPLGHPLGTWALRLAFEVVGRCSARLSDRLVSVNVRVARLLERLAGTRRKTVFLPNPIDPAVFYPPSPEQRSAARSALGWGDAQPRILFVGRLTADKGVDVLLRTAHPDYRLVFLGPGDPGVLGSLPRTEVQYLPPRPPDQMTQVYHAADVLVLPSRREGFPLVVQEALACGLPVLTTYDPGYAPYLPAPRLSFCMRDPADLEAAIRQILTAGPPSFSGSLTRICPPPATWGRLLLDGLR